MNGNDLLAGSASEIFSGPVQTHVDALLSAVGSLDGRRVLDIGCGEGVLGRELAQLGAEVTGVDPFVPAQDWEPQGSGRFRVLSAPAERVPLEDGSIDIAMFIFSLHHMSDVEQAMKEAHRVLAADGRLYIAEPVAAGDHNSLIATFHDEAAVREEAQRTLQRVAATLFGRHVTLAYTDRRVYPNFATFAARMIANRRFNGYSAEAVVAPNVRTLYAEIAVRTKGIFDQPVKVDVLHVAARKS